MFAQSGGSGWEDNVLMHGANRLPQGGDHDREFLASLIYVSGVDLLAYARWLDWDWNVTGWGVRVQHGCACACACGIWEMEGGRWKMGDGITMNEKINKYY
ncbi:hypothetical protein EYC84_008347 [Monilinia fructicola]|uniref:Uncharacterized protein n=1 Tax=Monilinia fructicola TaxID=38448 RepID=A0A5M9JF14_MONFR|nr:hypothetical protein EYC84_008347 [Monilinia fructicola]